MEPLSKKRAGAMATFQFYWVCLLTSCNMAFGTRSQKYYTHMAGRHHARQVREQAGLHERKGNVLRRMMNVTATSFTSWLKSTIRRSRRAIQRGDRVVDFIPFGVSGLITRDVHAGLCQL